MNESCLRAQMAERRPESRFHEFERQPVHAITQASRFWAILENVAKMGVTAGAENFSAGFSQAVVNSLPHVSFGDRRPKAGPAGVRFKLSV